MRTHFLRNHSMISRCKVSMVGLAGLLMAMTAWAQTDSMLAKLKRDGQLSCQPIDPNFCLNFHVSCAGRTSYQAFPFTFRAKEASGSMKASKDFDAFNELYANGKTEWSEDGTYAILSPAQGAGYVKLFDNGNYIVRFYPKNQEGLMSLGKCE